MLAGVQRIAHGCAMGIVAGGDHDGVGIALQQLGITAGTEGKAELPGDTLGRAAAGGHQPIESHLVTVLHGRQQTGSGVVAGAIEGQLDLFTGDDGRLDADAG
ncbi:hypothetical protein D3C81_1830730 [compost metagenome]